MTKYSQLEIRRRLQGKRLPINLRSKLDKFFGRSSTEIEAKKKLSNLLKGKSDLARQKIYKQMGLSYRERKRFENELFGGKMSLHEIKLAEKMEEKRKKMMVKLGKTSARLLGKNKGYDNDPLAYRRYGEKDRVLNRKERLKKRLWEGGSQNSLGLGNSPISTQGEEFKKLLGL